MFPSSAKICWRVGCSLRLQGLKQVLLLEIRPVLRPAVSKRNFDNFSSSRDSDTLIWDLSDCTSAFSLLLSAWVTLFGSNSSSVDKHGNFQTVPCQVDKSNQVNIAFTGLFL